MKNPYKLSDSFFNMSEDESNDDIDEFYVHFIKQIGGIENLDDDLEEVIKTTYLSGYIVYKDKKVKYYYN